MRALKKIRESIFAIESSSQFNELALEIFRFQATENEIYMRYIQALGINYETVVHYSKIPFLPIGFFKNHRVYCSAADPEIVFQSSGTTGSKTSSHFVADSELYIESFMRAFKMFYGKPEEYQILALLPSYIERPGSSLIYMVERLISASQIPGSGFYNTGSKKFNALIRNEEEKTILIGVTYALLDLAEATEIRNPRLIVMETGGMKGRRKEMVRQELHKVLIHAFDVNSIHSEYGMTELLSQAYSKGEGVFRTPPWMKILIRDTNDPLSIIGHNQTGGINVMDLANLYSCSFIATEDLGKSYPDGSFEVLGRFDASDIRGCNLLMF